jgi:hypothetical protein
MDDADPQLEWGAQPICPRIWRADAAAGLNPYEARELKTIYTDSFTKPIFKPQ